MLTKKLLSFGLVLPAMTALAATSFASAAPSHAGARGDDATAVDAAQPVASLIVDPTIIIYEFKAFTGGKKIDAKVAFASHVPESAFDK